MTNKISEGFATQVEIEDDGTPRIERTEVTGQKTIIETPKPPHG